MAIKPVDATDELLSLFIAVTGIDDFRVVKNDKMPTVHRMIIDTRDGFFEAVFAVSWPNDPMDRPAAYIRPMSHKWRIVCLDEDGDLDEEPIWPNRFDTKEEAEIELTFYLNRHKVERKDTWTVQAVIDKLEEVGEEEGWGGAAGASSA